MFCIKGNSQIANTDKSRSPLVSSLTYCRNADTPMSHYDYPPLRVRFISGESMRYPLTVKFAISHHLNWLAFLCCSEFRSFSNPTRHWERKLRQGTSWVVCQPGHDGVLPGYHYKSCSRGLYLRIRRLQNRSRLRFPAPFIPTGTPAIGLASITLLRLYAQQARRCFPWSR